MRVASLALALAVSLLPMSAHAQPGRDVGSGGRPGPGAEFFLARTGELRLTDAQVVRLAAIARRSSDRRRVMRASMDSLAARRGARRDSADRSLRTREMEQLRARFERERDASRADLRDALAVLTPDQQAMAWEMTSRGPGGRAARGGRFPRDGRPGRERRSQRGRGDRPRSEGQRPPQ